MGSPQYELQESEGLYRVVIENSRNSVALIRGDKHLSLTANFST